MSTRRALGRLTEARLAEICAADLGFVVLSRTTCGRCAVYQADIERLMDQGKLDGIPAGKVMLDEPGAAEFLAVNPWARDTAICPVTVIYRRGEEVARISTARAGSLLRRIAALSDLGSSYHSECAFKGGLDNEQHRTEHRDGGSVIDRPNPPIRWEVIPGSSER